MPENRFYTPVQMVIGDEVSLAEEESRHLRVMRNREGDPIELINGRGQLAFGIVHKILKNEVLIRVDKIHFEERNPDQKIIAQGIPKLPRLDVILEKGTELGMSALWLFPAELSEKTLISPAQKTRIEKVFIASLKQCGALYLPEIQILPQIIDWETLAFPTFYGDLSRAAPPFFNMLPGQKDLVFVVGPEKGLSSREIAHLKKLGAKGARLSKNILRTDTAPLAALSLMNCVKNEGY